MPPPPWLEWTSIALSLAALVLAAAALPTVLQVWFGKPTISVEFDQQGISPGVALICRVKNKPVENRLLKRLGVRRQEARELGGRVTIRESEGGKYIESLRITFGTGNTERQLRLDLHAGHPTLVLIAYHQWKDGNPTLSLQKDNEEEELKLNPGEYECELVLEWGQDRFETKRTFVVGNDHSKMRWRNLKSS